LWRFLRERNRRGLEGINNGGRRILNQIGIKGRSKKRQVKYRREGHKYGCDQEVSLQPESFGDIPTGFTAIGTATLRLLKNSHVIDPHTGVVFMHYYSRERQV
jgi:hypothetical protein